MGRRAIQILLIEDDETQADLVRKMLAKVNNGFELDWVPHLSGGLARLDEGGVDVVVLDLGLADSRGMETFRRAFRHSPGTPFIVLTGLADESLGLEAVRQGAQDYLVKGKVDAFLLVRSIRYAIERRRSQEALLIERQRLYSLLDALPAIIYLKAPDHSIRFATQSFREFFGSPEGRPCYQIFHGRSTPCADCPAIEVIQLQKPYTKEWTADTNRTYQVQYYPFTDLDGSPLILTMAQDITERKRMEEALKAEEQILEDIFNSIQDGLCILDLDRRIIRVNPAMKNFPHIRPILGRKCFEAYRGRDAPCESCPVGETIRNGKTCHGLVEARYEHGEKIIGEIFAYPLINRDTGELQGVIEYVRDVTERCRAEEALKDSEQKLRFLSNQLLTAQENERKRLSQGLHDELGHALLAMRLDLRAMEKQLLPEQVALAENISELMGYIGQIIENVRRLYLDLTPGDLEDLGLSLALRNLCEEFGRHRVKISWSMSLENIDGLFPLQVQTAIYRIFQEILTNIGKHADPTQVAVVVERRDGGASFTVKDNGRGFDSEQGWQRSPTGVGLLAIEERISMLGGDWELWSQKNQGTRISFSIPGDAKDVGDGGS